MVSAGSEGHRHRLVDQQAQLHRARHGLERPRYQGPSQGRMVRDPRSPEAARSSRWEPVHLKENHLETLLEVSWRIMCAFSIFSRVPCCGRLNQDLSEDLESASGIEIT